MTHLLARKGSIAKREEKFTEKSLTLDAMLPDGLGQYLTDENAFLDVMR